MKVGDTFITNEGEIIEVVKYNNCNSVIIRFIDEFNYEKEVTAGHCRDGKIKNPFKRKIYGVGYIGVGEHKVSVGRKVIREYTVWHSMLRRCYSGEYESYKDCTVCDRWLCFQSFCDDITKIEGYELWLNNPNKGISLDKDIKIPSNRVYSLETCCFVERDVNLNERIERCGMVNPPCMIKATNIKSKAIKYYKSIVSTEEDGFWSSAVHRCCNGEQKTHKGYYFEYVKEGEIINGSDN